jgi:negative regulator of replication initiation
MAVVHTDFYRHENLVRKSIQIPSTQHTELNALATELEASLGDVVETMMELMQQDNYQQLKTAILQKRQQALSSLTYSLDEAYDYLGSLPDTLEEACFCFAAACECMATYQV